MKSFIYKVPKYIGIEAPLIWKHIDDEKPKDKEVVFAIYAPWDDEKEFQVICHNLEITYYENKGFEVEFDNCCPRTFWAHPEWWIAMPSIKPPKDEK